MTDDAPGSAQPKSTTYLVTVGTALFMGMRWTLRVIGLLSTIVLARLLVPDDFGLVAIAASYIGLIESITDLSIRSSVIRHGGEDRRFLDTVFTIQLIRGAVIALIVVASSFILPQMMGDGRLKEVIWLLALNPLWSGFLNPHLALFERAMDFRREAALQIVAKLLSAAAAITAAVIFRSYWALIAGSLVGSLARVVLSYALSPFLPRLSLASWRTLFRFAGWLSASTTLDSVARGPDNLVIGGFLGVRSAGLYNVGATLADMPLGEFLPVVARTLFPGLLKFKDDVRKLRENALETFGVLCALSLPIAVGFSFVAAETVHILYGSKWADAVPIVAAIAVASGIESIGGAVATAVAMASGRTEMLFLRSVICMALRVPAFVLGAWLFGLPGAIAGYVVGSLAFAVANALVLLRILQASYAMIAERLWRALFAVAAMALALFAVQGLVAPGASTAGSAAALAIKVFVGIVVYVSVRLVAWKITGRPETLEARLGSLIGALQRRIARHT